MTSGAVERLGRLLIRRLGEGGRLEGDVVSVAEFHRQLLPYHVCRAELELTTKAEYDVLLLDLLAESSLLRVEEPSLAAAISRERASPEPRLAFLQRFAASRLRLLDRLLEPLATLDAETDDQGAAESEPALRPPPRPRDQSHVLLEPEWSAAAQPSAAPGRPPLLSEQRPAAPPRARISPHPRSDPVPAGCRRCSRPLPDRDGLRYCPYCGADQTVRSCESCAAELELDWAYCPLCGDAVASM